MGFAILIVSKAGDVDAIMKNLPFCGPPIKITAFNILSTDFNNC